MKTLFYVVGGYLLAVGAAQMVSNLSANSPTADTVASLPSFNSSTLDFVVGGAAVAVAYLGYVK